MPVLLVLPAACRKSFSAQLLQLYAIQVNGLMMNEYTGSDVATRVHEERWLHQMLSINDPHAVPQGGPRAKPAGTTAAPAAAAAAVQGNAAASSGAVSDTGQALQRRHRRRQQQAQQGR
jgi:hypothetical protein